jgi:hypothetical protein
VAGEQTMLAGEPTMLGPTPLQAKVEDHDEQAVSRAERE